VKQSSQIPLELGHEPSFELADFIVSDSNYAASQLVQSWPHWSSHVTALVGPEASGKTHLARAWAAGADAVILRPNDDISRLARGTAVLVEEPIESGWCEENLFHLFNWIKEISGSLLITAKQPPSRWDIQLPDLKSRLATITVGEIAEPDDDLLAILLAKLFSDRQLQVDAAVIAYILPRIERSFAAVVDMVEKLDKAALADKRKISRSLAKACLSAELD